MTYPHNPLDEEKDDERELVRDEVQNPAPNIAAADSLFGIFGFRRVDKGEEVELARKLDEERR